MIVFVMIFVVIEIFRSGEELELSSSHSLEHPFGAMSVTFCSGMQKLDYSTLNLLNILLNIDIELMFVGQI